MNTLPFEYSNNKRLRSLGEWVMRRFFIVNSYAEFHWWEFWIMIENQRIIASFGTESSRNEVLEK